MRNLMRLFQLKICIILILAACQHSATPPLPELAAFEKTRDSLRFHENTAFTLPQYLSKYAYLKSRFGTSTHPHITASFWGLKASMPLDEQTAAAVRSGTLPSEFLEFALGGLRKEALKSGKFADALDYDLRMQALYPDSKFLKQYPIPPRTQPVVHRAQLQFDSIARRNLPEEEWLWAVGNVWLRYCADKPAADYDNFDIAFQYLKELTRRFPDSQWADDAAFLQIKTMEEMMNEASNYTESLNFARRYEDLLRKYPKTGLRAEILYRAAFTYARFQNEGNQPREACREAEIISEQLLREFPDFAQKNAINDLLLYIYKKQMIYALELKIQSDKSVYRVGEPVWATFSLINQSNEPAEFELPYSSGCPNFDLRIDWSGADKGHRTVLGSNPQRCKPVPRRIVLAPGETYLERWDATQIPGLFSRLYDDTTPFPAPGRYLLFGCIKFSGPVERQMITSPPYVIQIEK